MKYRREFKLRSEGVARAGLGEGNTPYDFSDHRRWTLGEKIGAGSLGTVRHVTDLRGEYLDIADKELRIVFTSSKDPNGILSIERLRDAELAVRGINHPNVVRVHGSYTRPGHANEQGTHLIMEYLPGETLADYLRDETSTEEKALGIVRGIADGAATVFDRRGILHRDLKPANVMLTPNRGSVLYDFGVAKTPGEAEGTRLTQLGDDGQFLAPGAQDGYHFLSDDNYAISQIAAALRGDRRTPRDLRAEHFRYDNPLLRELFARNANGDPQQRSANSIEFRRELEAIIGGSPIYVPQQFTLTASAKPIADAVQPVLDDVAVTSHNRNMEVRAARLSKRKNFTAQVWRNLNDAPMVAVGKIDDYDAEIAAMEEKELLLPSERSVVGGTLADQRALRLGALSRYNQYRSSDKTLSMRILEGLADGSMPLKDAIIEAQFARDEHVDAALVNYFVVNRNSPGVRELVTGRTLEQIAYAHYALADHYDSHTVWQRSVPESRTLASLGFSGTAIPARANASAPWKAIPLGLLASSIIGGVVSTSTENRTLFASAIMATAAMYYGATKMTHTDDRRNELLGSGVQNEARDMDRLFKPYIDRAQRQIREGSLWIDTQKAPNVYSAQTFCERLPGYFIADAVKKLAMVKRVSVSDDEFAAAESAFVAKLQSTAEDNQLVASLLAGRTLEEQTTELIRRTNVGRLSLRIPALLIAPWELGSIGLVYETPFDGFRVRTEGRIKTARKYLWNDVRELDAQLAPYVAQARKKIRGTQ